MNDKLEVQIPPRTPFTPDFAQVLKNAEHVLKRKRGEPYFRIGSFKNYGHEVVLWQNLNPNQYPSRLNIISTSTKKPDWMLEQIARVYQINPNGLRVLRTDFAADVPLSMDWLRRNTWVKFKQATREYPVRCSKRGVETLYFGQVPNQLVMYDKGTERLKVLGREMGATAHRAEVQARFAERHPEWVGLPWTRVEKRYGSKGVPRDIRTVERLFANMAAWEPFSSMRITPIAEVEPQCFGCSVGLYYKVLGVWRDILRIGMHATIKQLNERSNRNGSKIWRQVEPYLPKSADIVVPNLNEVFQQSVSRQLAA